MMSEDQKRAVNEQLDAMLGAIPAQDRAEAQEWALSYLYAARQAWIEDDFARGDDFARRLALRLAHL